MFTDFNHPVASLARNQASECGGAGLVWPLGRHWSQGMELETLAELEPMSDRCDLAEGQVSDADALSRRSFLQGATLVAGGLGLASPSIAFGEAPADSLKLYQLRLTINGTEQEVQVDPRISLLDLLREQLGMSGTKKGCDHGQCGACTVLADGRRINSCLSLALTHQGGKVVTVEGLAQGDSLHPVQTAFLEHDGYQCGYCTPGQIVSAVGLLSEAKQGHPSSLTALTHSGPVDLTADEIRERMSGNICRCGAYPGIVAAVQQAFRQG